MDKVKKIQDFSRQWPSRKKAVVAICELLNVLLVSMRSIMSSQTANVFGSEPLCSGTLQQKRQDRVERRQWLPSVSCLKSCPVGNVFNFSILRPYDSTFANHSQVAEKTEH